MEQKKVLLAEDEDVLRDMLVDFFEMQGYYIEAVDNGADALNLWKKKDFDIIITDINMPIMSGLELLESVKTKESDFPVIIITGVSLEKAKYEANHYGADSFITKPFKMKNLFATIEEHLK